MKKKNNIKILEELGQSIWMDNISRKMIQSGELETMINDGLLGITSNPTIFEKAITGSNDYDLQIRNILKDNPSADNAEIIVELMFTDITNACDSMERVYERTGGRDGYVSMEVSPSKAHNTGSTIEEVRDIRERVNRNNLMIKIPATREGIPAIEQMIYEGININVTLIFSEQRYREVANAYLAGLERRVKEDKRIDHIASVASVFVSRVDTLVDRLLVESGVDNSEFLKGKAAVANSRKIYNTFRQIFSSDRFNMLRDKGARVQRPLWGSTSRKNPEYDELKYVESLIAPDTVNTVPPVTYNAILEKLNPRLAVDNKIDDADSVLNHLTEAGIGIKQVMKTLESEGVSTFEKSYDSLYESIAEKREEFTKMTVGG